MIIRSVDFVYAVQRGRVMRIERAAGWVPSCEEGALLVTQAGDSRDFELFVGDELQLGTNGLVLVDSHGNALCSLLPPERTVAASSAAPPVDTTQPN